MMSHFLSAFGLGIIFFAIPGAVTAQLVRRGFERGFLSALALQLGAALGVAMWFIIALVGGALLTRYALARFVLGVVGSLFLLLLMWRALRDDYRGSSVEPITSGEAKLADAPRTVALGDFAVGSALSLATPLPLVFWLSVSGAVIPTGTGAASLEDLVLFLAGFLLSALLWSSFMAGLIAWGRRFVTPLFLRLTNLLCGLALGYFAVRLLWGVIALLRG
jgi:chemosensory pili system protein ChpE